MTTTEELYDDLPEELKEVFKTKAQRDKKMKEEGKTPYDIMKETLDKIKAINNRSQTNS